MLYRFVLAFCGEPQGVGFFCGFDDIGLPKTEADRLSKPFDNLAVPNLTIDPGRDSVQFWLTEQGLSHYSNAIDSIVNAIGEYDWSLIGYRIPNSISVPIYSDDDQVALRATETVVCVGERESDAQLLRDTQ